MRRKLGNLISVFVTAVKLGILKLLHGKNLCTYLVERFSPDVIIEMKRGAKVSFGNRVRIHSGSKIKVRQSGDLTIGDGVKINYSCIIVCRKKIEIGEGTEFGPSVYLYDHDHDFRAGLKQTKFREGDIIIGKNCWIGAQTVILRGTKLGDNCVVGAGSVIKGNFGDGSVIIQERKTLANVYEVTE